MGRREEGGLQGLVKLCSPPFRELVGLETLPKRVTEIWSDSSQGFEHEASVDVSCLSESLSNRLGDLLGRWIADVED
jgi:hypothetical protein